MHILIIQNTNPIFKPTMDVTQKHLAQIKAVLPTTTVNVENDTENLEKSIGTADIIITPNINLLPLQKSKNLRWIQVTSAGVNGLSKELVENGVIITNASGVHPIPIAEHVMGFILMFAHQLHALHRTQVTKKIWDYSYQKYPIVELKGKTIGITGLGRIGTYIAKLAKGFDMHTMALVRNMDKKYPFVDELVTDKTCSKLLTRADFVVNAMPLTNETKYFFDMEKFKQMKPSSYFINIGRGPVVREKDLIKALETNIIAGAGLDVFEEEPLPQDSPLWNMENVIITPHSSGQTPEYMNRVINIFCDNLKAYLSKKTMPNLVDKRKGY